MVTRLQTTAGCWDSFRKDATKSTRLHTNDFGNNNKDTTK